MADKYKAQLDAFAMEFEKRFKDDKNLEPLFNIFSSQYLVQKLIKPQRIYC